MKLSRQFTIFLLIILHSCVFFEASSAAREIKLRLPYLCTAQDLPWLQITDLESGKIYKTQSPRVHMLDQHGTLCVFRIPQTLLGNVLLNLETGTGYATAWSWYAKVAIDGSSDVIEVSPPNAYGSFEVVLPREFYEKYEHGKLDWYVTVFRLEETTGLPDAYTHFSASIFPPSADKNVLLDVPFLISGKYLLVVESSDGNHRAYQKTFVVGETDLHKFQPNKTPLESLKAFGKQRTFWRVGKEAGFKGFIAVGLRRSGDSERVDYLDKEGTIKKGN